MSHRTSMTALLLLVFAVPAWGEQKSLDLPELIRQALEHNPALKATAAEARSKDAETGPKGAYEDPMLEVEAMNYPVDTLKAGDLGMTAVQVSLSQKIPFPGKLGKLRSAAEFEAQASHREVEQEKLKLIREVKAAYFEWYLAHKKREILLERQNLLRQLLVSTRSRYAVGKAPQAEVLGMQVEEANLIGQGLTLETTIRSKLAMLAMLVGREQDASEELLPAAARVERTKLKLSQLTEESLLERALAHNPSLKAATSGVEAAEARLSFSKWNYLPDFEFTFRYAFRDPNMDDRGVDAVSGAIGMSIPLWAFTKQSGEVKARSAERIRADALLTQQRNELRQKVKTTYSELLEASKRLELYESGLLPLARQSVVTARAAYLAGKLEYVALLNLINTRFQTEQDFHETLVTYETKIADLEELLGGELGGTS